MIYNVCAYNSIIHWYARYIAQYSRLIKTKCIILIEYHEQSKYNALYVFVYFVRAYMHINTWLFELYRANNTIYFDLYMILIDVQILTCMFLNNRKSMRYMCLLHALHDYSNNIAQNHMILIDNAHIAMIFTLYELDLWWFAIEHSN